jgi:predicted dehydrogenase
MKKQLNVGLIGHKFMGKAHSHAYRDVAMFFPLDIVPVMKMVSGVEDDVKDIAEQYGWQSYTHDWEQVVYNPEIDLIDITTPDAFHKDIAIAALKEGKHVICEKPLAISLADAREMYAAAAASGVKHLVNFNYRRVPAVVLAKKLIDEGKLGNIYHFNALYQQDFALDEKIPYAWRMDKKLAGAGTMADKGAHILDLGRFLVGELDAVSCMSATFIKERDVPGQPGVKKPVTTNDAAVFIGRYANGALGLFETSNMSAGRKNALSFEVNGSKGSVHFDLERLNELQVYFADDADDVQGFRTVIATEPSHQYIKAWWPSGHIIGWEHTFVHQVYEMLKAISEDYQPTPSFLDGLRCQELVAAVAQADEENRWVKISEMAQVG